MPDHRRNANLLQRVLTNILLYRAAEAPRSPLQIDLTP